MTFIIHTKGFDLDNQLHDFIEASLSTLLRLPIAIAEAIITLGESSTEGQPRKYCRIKLTARERTYNSVQYANAYEEAVLRVIKQLDAILQKM
ncbi:MAG TPA: HPF/RaiA family ribosome-associated protein [Chitinophagaceae bacterium]|nr:HPF/RaiA family ribosome-associated protein [Chitinophagaceae bacterium]